MKISNLLVIVFIFFMIFACWANSEVKHAYYIQGCTDGINKDRNPILLNPAGGSISAGLQVVEEEHKKYLDNKNYCEKVWKSYE